MALCLRSETRQHAEVIPPVAAHRDGEQSSGCYYASLFREPLAAAIKRWRLEVRARPRLLYDKMVIVTGQEDVGIANRLKSECLLAPPRLC